MTADEIIEFMRRTYPQSHPDRFRIEAVTDGSVKLRYRVTHDDLRPGDTVSGPTLMMLSDAGMYFALLASIGQGALAATTNLNINFLNRSGAGELVVEAKILKLGKRLAVGEVFVHADGSPDPVSLASVTYSISEAR
jgi:uncharacterized protein (TIGR00369 family)